MKKLALLVALPIALWVTTASAAIITYTSEATWLSAVGTVSVEPFNASGLQPFTDVTTHDGSIGSARGVLSGSVWRDRVRHRDDEETTTFEYLPGSLLGAGAYWDTSPAGQEQGLVITLNLTGGGTQTVGQIGPINGTFFGWTSTSPFSSFTIRTTSGYDSEEEFDLDKLSFAASAPAPVATPEPATLALLGTGLVGVCVLHRRKSTGR